MPARSPGGERQRNRKAAFHASLAQYSRGHRREYHTRGANARDLSAAAWARHQRIGARERDRRCRPSLSPGEDGPAGIVTWVTMDMVGFLPFIVYGKPALDDDQEPEGVPRGDGEFVSGKFDRDL
jgi:hypothetical protein